MCDNTISDENYVAEGKKALILWKTPSLKCNFISVFIDPPMDILSWFGVGSHTLIHELDYSEMPGMKSLECSAVIHVKGGCFQRRNDN